MSEIIFGFRPKQGCELATSGQRVDLSQGDNRGSCYAVCHEAILLLAPNFALCVFCGLED